MAGNILSQEKNPNLEREEFVLELTSKASPSEAEAKEAIGKDSDLTVIKRINSNFGRNTFKIEAVVYNSKEAKDKIETIPAKVKKKMEAEKKAEEAKRLAAEEAAKKAEEEAKAVETKEEAPAEAEDPKEE